MTVPHSLLDGRRILLTGGATGIGAAAVQVLGAAGVAATYHRTAPADDTAAATWLQCDVRDADAVDAAFNSAVSELDGLDVLVNAAGLWQSGVPGYITSDEIDFLLVTNIKATILTNQAAYAVMRENCGRIINFGSAEAVMGSRSQRSTPLPRAPFKPRPAPRPRRGERSGSPSTRWLQPFRHRARIGCGTSWDPALRDLSTSR